MAENGSVAPKERVNITYAAATGDATEDKELPLKMLVIGDFTGKADSTAVEDRKPINVDKNNFDEVLGAQGISMNLNVKNTLAEEGGDLAVKLKVGGMKDFSPESVARQVPELNALLQLREALNALKGPLGNMPAFRKKIQELVGDEGARTKLLSEISAATEAGKS